MAQIVQLSKQLRNLKCSKPKAGNIICYKIRSPPEVNSLKIAIISNNGCQYSAVTNYLKEYQFRRLLFINE